MKISNKLEYALRALAQIGYSYGSGRLAHIEELARDEDIPQNYLIQILNKLRTGGLLKSKRGKSGGYTLAKAPSEISLLDIATVIDAELLAGKATLAGQSGVRVVEVWGNFSSQIKALLRGIPLSALSRPESVPQYDI